MSDTPAVPPAISADLWAAHQRHELCVECYVADMETLRTVDDVTTPEDITRHALAALCLYGQPYGFTREDIETLKRHVDLSRDQWADPKLLSLVDRIAALLPSESAGEKDA